MYLNQKTNPKTGDLVKVVINFSGIGIVAKVEEDYGIVLRVLKYKKCKKNEHPKVECRVLWLNNNTGLLYLEDDDHTTWENPNYLTLVQKAQD